MARRKEAKKDERATAPSQSPEASRAEGPAGAAEPKPARILIVSSSRLERLRLAARLGDAAGVCIQAESIKTALQALEAGRCDAALIGQRLPDGVPADLARELARRDPASVSLLISDAPTLDDAVQAMRAGVVDIVSPRAAAAELTMRVKSALGRARVARDREDRLERLGKVCRQLNEARSQITRQVSGLCGDLASAYQDLSDQVTLLSTASEFNSLIRQELEVESLLRTALEFILAKTGPTNAAVFLPATSCDFSLGAYVNYDLPKDTADTMLESLAGVMAPRLEHERGLKLFTTQEEIAHTFGESAYWLGESHIAAFTCRRDGECLAVVALFRDRRTGFPDAILPALGMIAELFGKQLARVIHIHHRHLPKDQWGGFGALDERGEDDIDLAA
jgi:DNA-binding response OmpR family regulator